MKRKHVRGCVNKFFEKIDYGVSNLAYSSYLSVVMDLAKSVYFSTTKPSAVIKVTGEDALAFLQGQFSQELRSAEPALSTYGLWLNQKGKVLADSYVLKEGNDWYLVSFSSPASVILARLEAYIIADDVVLKDVTAGWKSYLVAGEGATDALRRLSVVLPGSGGYCRPDGGFLFRGRRDRHESWEWLVPVDVSFPAPLQGLSTASVGEREIEARRIQAGVPRVPEDVGPNDLPNEAGLEEVAISFTKGCYLGQEVIARLRSMGQVRRRLRRVASSEAISAGALLFRGEKKAGEIRSVASNPDGIFNGLAMISLVVAADAQHLSLSPNGAAVVEILSEQ